jgi:hypothetical protein
MKLGMKNMKKYDKIIIGAGLYGLYSAELCGRNGQNILVLECDCESFGRATYINQARVHQGYHYPRSLSTALKSAGYFKRFNEDYNFCINKEFKQIYATSSEYSWSNAEQFKKFCAAANIPCTELSTDNFFKPNVCDGAFLTKEYTYDAKMLRDYFLDKIENLANVSIKFDANIIRIEKDHDEYIITLKDGSVYSTGFLLNVTYAATNQIIKMLNFDPFRIKYELCEIILCKVNEDLQDYGLTVMDGPFFSIMPFGKTGFHSLTSVTFTPHKTSFSEVPEFECQNNSAGYCTPNHLGNCNNCPSRPKTAFPYMNSLAKKYMNDNYQFSYSKSLFSMKPILMASEVDDSRPTVIRKYSDSPTFISVLSGKINTVYDLDEVLIDGKY